MPAHAKQLARAMLNDTDTGKIVLGASYVDELLTRLIVTTLIDDPVSQKLFSPNDAERPGLIFKAKLAFALGLISDQELTDARLSAGPQ